MPRQRPGERLRVLHSPSAAQPAREQSLRATLDWSKAPLGDAERAMLCLLGVFKGSFNLRSAQTIGTDASFDDGAALNILGALVNRSLVEVDAASAPRYRLLKTTRLYAQGLRAEPGDDIATVLRQGLVTAVLSRWVHADFHTPGDRPLRERYGADYVDLNAALDSTCSRGDAGLSAETAQALLKLDRAAHRVTASTRRRMAAAHALLAIAGDDLLRAWLCTGAAPVASVAISGVLRLEFAGERVAARRDVGNPQELYRALAALATERARAGDEAAADAAVAVASAVEDCRWPPAPRTVGARIDAKIAMYSRRNGPSRMTAALRAMPPLAQQSGAEERVAVAKDCLADATTASGNLPEAIALGHAALANQRRQLGAEQGQTLMNLCAAMLLSGDEAPARALATLARALAALARALAALALPLLRLNLQAGLLCNHRRRTHHHQVPFNLGPAESDGLPHHHQTRVAARGPAPVAAGPVVGALS